MVWKFLSQTFCCVSSGSESPGVSFGSGRSPAYAALVSSSAIRHCSARRRTEIFRSADRRGSICLGSARPNPLETALSWGFVDAFTMIVSTQSDFVPIRARTPHGLRVLRYPEMTVRHHANSLPLLTSADHHGLVTQAEWAGNLSLANYISQPPARTPFGRASLSRCPQAPVRSAKSAKPSFVLGDAVCRCDLATNTATGAGWEYTFC